MYYFFIFSLFLFFTNVAFSGENFEFKVSDELVIPKYFKLDGSDLSKNTALHILNTKVDPFYLRFERLSNVLDLLVRRSIEVNHGKKSTISFQIVSNNLKKEKVYIKNYGIMLCNILDILAFQTNSEWKIVNGIIVFSSR